MLKKVLSVLLAVVLAVGAFSVATFAQSDEIRNVDVEIVYAPITSKIVYESAFSPVGIVLKVTYPDGKTENLTVERIDDGNYRAGNFNVTASLFKLEIIGVGTVQYFGMQSVPIVLDYEAADGTVYKGVVNCDFFNFPSFVSLIYIIADLFTAHIM